MLGNSAHVIELDIIVRFILVVHSYFGSYHLVPCAILFLLSDNS